MCAKDDLIRRKGLLLTSTQTPNYVDTFSLDFAFSQYRLSYSHRATVMLIIILVDKTQLLLISGDVARSTPSTLLAKFIPTTKIRNPLLKKNAAKSRILLACVDGRTRQYYLTICAILANYEEQVLLTSIKKNRYCMHCTKHYNFNIHVSLATDTLHLLLKGLVIKMLDFMQDMLDNIYPSTVVSLLFISKAPFALHFIYAVCDLVTLAQYKRIQPYLIKLPLSEVAANIAISNFIYAAALYLILIIINYTCYDKDRKHIAYIKAFSKVLLFNNNRQINNTTRMLSILQAFKFYDLSTIIRLVHLVPRDLPNSITYTTISYYVNNYID
ncbi:hypothetical protein HBH75_239030 [Parastagonospora nodorum]|nr:hypothetical protein HBH75_239030 [Parastagonospora nodorum]